METSYIEVMNKDYLLNLGFQPEQLNFISELVKKGIQEKLYTNTKDFKHDLKHIERVLTYVQWILNEKKKNGKVIENQELLFYATLYHDIGKTIGASNKEHGKVGSQEVYKYLEDALDKKSIKIVSSLIKTHASEDDRVEFSEDFSEEEKKRIQELSDILKDADALDRNRLNYPAPMGVCDVNKLRTQEARKILKFSDQFLEEYNKAIIFIKEKESGTKIFNNYQKLDEWIQQYLENKKNGQEEIGYMFHASMDPGIFHLTPIESTQKGSYVYAGVDPVDCFTMATFRLSSLFKRGKNEETKVRQIIDVFPGTIEATLQHKFLTIYRVPEQEFTEYVRASTSSSRREWVSSKEIFPVEEVTFPAMDLLNHIKEKGLLEIVENPSERFALKSMMPGRINIWDLKKVKENPLVFAEKHMLIEQFLNYYAPHFLPAYCEAEQLMLREIQKYSSEYFQEHHEYPDYSSEDEVHIKQLENIILPKLENRDYIDYLLRVAETSKKKQNLSMVLDELVEQKEENKKNSLKLGKISLKIFWLLEILSVGIILTSFFLLLK